jgi:hypothetical protein
LNRIVNGRLQFRAWLYWLSSEADRGNQASSNDQRLDFPAEKDRGSGYHFAILSRHQPATLKFATHPLKVTPAMEAGLTDYVWNLTELLSATDR